MADNREALAWDRLGRFLEEGGSTASGIAQRHLGFWSSVSDHLRKGDKYTADDMAGDLASSMSTAMSDIEDLWSLVARFRPDSQTPYSLSTVFLLLRATGPRAHALPNPVTIDVDPEFRTLDLPRRAIIQISARFPSADHVGANQNPIRAFLTAQSIGVPRLREFLVARRRKKALFYVLEGVNRRLTTSGPNAPGAVVESALIPGVYDGLVYLDDPAVALAELRIVVEGGADPLSPDGP